MIKSEDKTMTKKIYNQPKVTVASIALQSNLLAGSAGDNMSISNTETSTVW